MVIKINKTWLGFHEDITKLMDILKRNLSPAHLIERVIFHSIAVVPKAIIDPRVPFSSLHIHFTLSILNRSFFCYYSKKDSPFHQALLQ